MEKMIIWSPKNFFMESDIKGENDNVIFKFIKIDRKPQIFKEKSTHKDYIINNSTISLLDESKNILNKYSTQSTIIDFCIDNEILLLDGVNVYRLDMYLSLKEKISLLKEDITYSMLYNGYVVYLFNDEDGYYNHVYLVFIDIYSKEKHCYRIMNTHCRIRSFFLDDEKLILYSYENFNFENRYFSEIPK